MSTMRIATLAVAIFAIIPVFASEGSDDLRSRHLKAAEDTFLATLMVSHNTASARDATRGSLGHRPYELALGVFLESHHPDAPRLLVDLVRYEFDAALSEDYHCVVWNRRADLGEALASVDTDADALAKRCASDVAALQRKLDPGKWKVDAGRVCRTPDEIRANVAELRQLVREREWADCE